MKRLTIIAGIALMMLGACQNEKETPQYDISGRIIDAKGDVIYLARSKNGNVQYLDSAEMVNGKFEMKGSIDQPENLLLVVGDDENYFPVFMSNDQIVILADFDSLDQAEITGAPYQTELEVFNASGQVIDEQRKAIYKGYKEAEKNDDEAEMDKYDAEWDALDKRQKEEMIQYVKDHPASPVSPYIIRTNIYYFDLADLETMDAFYDKSLDKSPYLIYLRERIDGLKKVAVGKKYTDFTMEDLNGNDMSISDFDGKYRLVDFWASWCGPCRAENPNLVDMMNKYKDKNFTIIGVSFDKNGDKWEKAVADDHLDWPQMSDLKGWKSAAGKIYMINSIPSNVLIDPDGIIIGKNLRGDDLRKKLTELLGK